MWYLTSLCPPTSEEGFFILYLIKITSKLIHYTTSTPLFSSRSRHRVVTKQKNKAMSLHEIFFNLRHAFLIVLGGDRQELSGCFLFHLLGHFFSFGRYILIPKNLGTLAMFSFGAPGFLEAIHYI